MKFVLILKFFFVKSITQIVLVLTKIHSCSSFTRPRACVKSYLTLNHSRGSGGKPSADKGDRYYSIQIDNLFTALYNRNCFQQRAKYLKVISVPIFYPYYNADEHKRRIYAFTILRRISNFFVERSLMSTWESYFLLVNVKH